MDKVRSNIAGFNAVKFSLAGTTTLIKLVLSTPPFFNMQTVMLPSRTCQEIEKLCRSFLWGGGEDRKTLEFGKLARRVFKQRHGWTWNKKEEINEQGLPHEVGLGLTKSARVDVLNDAQLVRFWKDPWTLGSKPLEKAPIGETPKEQLNKKVIDFVNTDGSWDWPLFQHRILASELMNVAATLPLDLRRGSDIWCWLSSGNRMFTMKSAYGVVEEESGTRRTPIWRAIWTWPGPERVKKCLSLAAEGRLMTN
ncbi:OLC1v1036030C1 [Oldenlandia corymbosa var. corymbosa]|uniref:OLC1v1036030C1 n=1 Tax=Oldenlandia corymbosa var. corymbosa TaxID=529605 RepID=A0AAV1CUY5_OLDCO|nr:OLC1v1036030C1 [Oldenlandia corymbosa var. corymbosa]